MFERFTERARKVVVLAQDEARHFNHNYIGTEHLLLGLLREDEGVAAQALTSLNVTLDEVREQVESIVGYGEEGTGAQAPFTPRSKKVSGFRHQVRRMLRHAYAENLRRTSSGGRPAMKGPAFGPLVFPSRVPYTAAKARLGLSPRPTAVE